MSKQRLQSLAAIRRTCTRQRVQPPTRTAFTNCSRPTCHKPFAAQTQFDPQWRANAEKAHREDTPLSEVGHTQAHDVAAFLQSTNTKLSHIFASPFLRTIETALPLARATGLPLKLENSVWEALCHRPPPDHTGNALFSVDAEHVSSFTPKTRETRPLSLQRVQFAAKRLVERFPISTGHMAIYSHADPVIYLVATLCGLSVEHVPPVPPATVFHIRRSYTATRGCDCFEMVRNSSIEHLSLNGPTGPAHPHYPVQCDWMNMLSPPHVDRDWPRDGERLARLKEEWSRRYHNRSRGGYGQWPNCPY
jgi:broad specificity phosphatase PhoE